MSRVCSLRTWPQAGAPCIAGQQTNPQMIARAVFVDQILLNMKSSPETILQRRAVGKRYTDRGRSAIMNHNMQRRGFLTRSMGIAALSALSTQPEKALAAGEVKRRRGSRIKIALNAYSFNRPLTAGKMTLDDVIDYCAMHNIDGVDTTGYYFPGYPNAPSDEYIYNLKKKAYLNGVTINGTGVRNDFALPDTSSRKGNIQLVKDWIEVARKLGANVVRVFSGRELPKGYNFDQVLEWMIPAFQECVRYGQQHGVIVGLQHHDDFLKTAD